MMKQSDKKIDKLSWEKSHQKAKLLVVNPDFQRETRKLREKWNIPKDGIKTNEESEKWHKWFYRKSDRYEESKEFLEQKIKLRKRINNLKKKGNKDTYKKIFEDNKALSSTIPINAFREDLNKLRVKFRLSTYWENFLRRYLLFIDLKLAEIPEGNVNIQKRINEETGETELYLRIYGNTTIKDIEKLWWVVKINQEGLLDYEVSKQRFKKLSKFERDKRVAELTEQGLTDKEICKKIKEEFEDESLMYYDISKIRHRFKRKIHHL